MEQSNRAKKKKEKKKEKKGLVFVLPSTVLYHVNSHVKSLLSLCCVQAELCCAVCILQSELCFKILMGVFHMFSWFIKLYSKLHITFEYFENLCEGICLYGATGRRCETNDFIVINYVVISYMDSPWIQNQSHKEVFQQ